MDLSGANRSLCSRTPLIGGWQRRRAARALARAGTPEAVRMLAEAVTRTEDQEVRAIALAALRAIEDQPAIDVACAVWAATRHRDLAAVLVAGGFAPRDEVQRTLFYFLAGQWEKYEALDFDRSRLQTVYETADERLRQRIMRRAREAGRVEWVAATRGRRGRRLGEMTDDEWETALALLEGSGRYAELWRLAQEAPARWSARLLRRVSEAGWAPGVPSEREGLEQLAALAAHCPGNESFPRLSWRLKTLEGHTYGVCCLAISPEGRLLASGSSDCTVRLSIESLSELLRAPIAKLGPEDLSWAQDALGDKNTDAGAIAWLRFTLALARWHRRFDIGLEDAPRRIAAGEFDIEIEG